MDDHDLSPDETPARQAAKDEPGTGLPVLPSADGHAELPEPGAGDRRGRRSPRWLAAAVAVVALVAIGGIWTVASGDDGEDHPRVVSSGAGQSFWGRRWQVTGFEGGGAPPVPERAERGPLELDLRVEGQVSYSGCNGGSGTGRVEGSKLVIDEGFIATAMACIDEPGKVLMAYDAWMEQLLMSGPTIDLAGSTLTISSAKGRATFRAIEAPDTTVPAEGGSPDAPVGNEPGSVPPTVPGPTVVPGAGGGWGSSSPGSPGSDGIWGARWLVSGATVDGEDQTLVPSRKGEPLTLNFATEGRVGFNGCNGGGSDAHLDGDRLMVDGIVATRMMCLDGDGRALMAQDAWMTELFDADPTVSIEGDTLTLTTDTSVLTATRLLVATPRN